MSKEKRFVIQIDPLEIEDDAIFDNKELMLYECQSDMMTDICSLLNKQDKQIADLEAKLAEKESEIKVGEFWHSAYQGKQLDYDKVYAELRQLYDENEKLKQQLAEKDKEIDERMMAFEKRCQEYYKSKEFTIEQLENVKEHINCYMAIREGDLPYNIECLLLDFADKIDNKIKEIKGE